MTETCTSSSAAVDLWAPTPLPGDGRPSESVANVTDACSELYEVCTARGLHLDSRAKYACGRILHWARVLETDGREIGSSGGWFDSEYEALTQAMATLELLPVPSSR